MKLLILTQKVDRDDPILGFFHGWILKLSKKFENIIVICLQKGNSNLPENVKVLSLGKEKGENKFKYVFNFYKYVFGERKNYNAVFVHMNQEYVLLGGLFWKIFGRKIYFWRNHPQGSLLTKIAVCLSNKVFCTSKDAFTAKYKKTKIMPAGIDTNIFKAVSSQQSASRKNKIMFLGRISPIKKPDLLIDALEILNNQNTDFICDFYGDCLPKDKNYFEFLKKKVLDKRLDGKVFFHPAVPNYETPEIYAGHEIFVNLTPSGSFDKTILEAAACGLMLVLTNKSLIEEMGEMSSIVKNNPGCVAEGIKYWLNAGENVKKPVSEKLQKYVKEKHSLDILINKITGIIS